MSTRARPSCFRLPAAVRPTDYDLHLVPDLAGGRFTGQVRIGVRLATACRAVTLHAADLAVQEAGATVGGRRIEARTSLDPATETVTLHFPRPLAAGEATLSLAYAGALGARLRGFYVVEAGAERFAFTHCQPADARRFLPCFDEPAFKARFRIAVTAADGDAVVSNAPIERVAGARGTRTVHFAPTPPLSSYLLAVALGPLQASAPRPVGGTTVRVWHVAGREHLTQFALEAAAESLVRLEAYFGIPYPYAKLDLVAVPDFEVGAMENAGAVFFREALLLLDVRTASLEEQKRAAAVIAHELAHMWYGNLVTMRWWDDLWLNEAFATWMASRIVADWRPDWRLAQSFEQSRATALAWDGLVSTHPVYTRVRSAAEALANFDPITYLKGATVVAMLEQYLGRTAFRDGVRRYVARHREGSTVAADLWRALEEASGREVTRVAQAWIERAGFPLVSVSRGRDGDGRRLTVRQERFFADPRVASPRRRGCWPVPLVVRWATDGGVTAEERFLVGARRATVTLPSGAPSWCCANVAAGGFYRVLYDARTRAALGRGLFEALSAVERLAFLGDQWALAHAGRVGIESFLEVAEALADETDPAVLEGLVGPFALLDEQVVAAGSEGQRALRAWIAARFGPAFSRLGWSAKPGEDDVARLRRAALLRLVGGVAEAPGVLAAAAGRGTAYLADRTSLEPNLADAVVDLAARGGDAATFARFREAAAHAATPQERRRFLLGLGSFRRPEAVAATLEAALTPEIPAQDVAFVLIRMLSNPVAREATWRFLAARWRMLAARLPPLMLARLVESTPALREPRYAAKVTALLRANPLPEAARALRQATETFRVNAELRRRAARRLFLWLRRRGRYQSRSLPPGIGGSAPLQTGS